MVDNEIWKESFMLAKDQLRHGKITVNDLDDTTQQIYNKLISLSKGPIIDTFAIHQNAIEQNQHLKTNKFVSCAKCGKEFKVLTTSHLQSCGFKSRNEYMSKYNVSKADLSVKVKRKTTKGDANPLSIMAMIMKSYEIKREDVMQFLNDLEFKDIKDLKLSAVDSKMSPLELLYKRKEPAVNLQTETAPIVSSGKTTTKKNKNKI